MNKLLKDLDEIQDRCQRIAQTFDKASNKKLIDRLQGAASEVGRGWSKSWIGYHANVYIDGLRPAQPGEHFDTEWGGIGGSVSRTRGPWVEYDPEAVQDEIIRRAGGVAFAKITPLADAAEAEFDGCKDELVAIADASLAHSPDDSVRQLRDEAASLESHVSARKFLDALIPKQHISRDSLAMGQGLRTPAHLSVTCKLAEITSYAAKARELARIARRMRSYLEKKGIMRTGVGTNRSGPIFIGHGRSKLWKELKEFLAENLHLQVEEFNAVPVAGRSNKERLLEMLDRCTFAFLVMTAEDEHTNQSLHARESVIHEVGLFQGRYCFERAIVLLEDGCEEFSNIHGIGQIRFPPGDIMAKSEEIRRVLKREGLLS